MMNSQFTSSQKAEVTMTPHFSLSPELFAQAFPFHLVFNRDTELVQIGKVLQQLYPQLSVGSQLGEHFRVNRPSIQVEFQAIRARSRSLFLLESLHNAMKLKGQMMYIEQSEAMVFLGSPWITDMEELQPLGLKLNDFAIHDPVTDYLFLLQAQNTALADAKKLTEKLTAQRAEIRKALEKEKELSELKSHFITTISHEFRTPLTKILGSTEVLEHYSHKWTDEKKVTYLHRIKANVQHLTQMLNDVLMLSQAEAGVLNLNPVPLDLAEFCRDLLQELQLTNGKQQTLTFVSPGSSTQACLDKKLLRQILDNLLSNAIKYSPPCSSIQLELACQDGTAIFQIQDRGIGIAPDDEKRLFESFYRGKNVGNIPGTGLGLAITKKAVESQGGKIVVNSEVGVGTTFTVTIPFNQ